VYTHITQICYIDLPPPYPFGLQINSSEKPALKYQSHYSGIFYGLLKYPSTEKPKSYKDRCQKCCLRCTKFTFHSVWCLCYIQCRSEAAT